MTVSIILTVVLILVALMLSYAYIKFANQKDKEFNSKTSELDQYKLAVQTIEKFVNMPQGKRLGLYSNVDNETLGILSRCGFAIRVIYDLEKDKNHIEVYKLNEQLNQELQFRASGKDLISIINKNVLEQDRLTADV